MLCSWYRPRPPQNDVVGHVGTGENPAPPYSPEAAAGARFPAVFRPAVYPACFSRLCCVLCVRRKPERRQPGTAGGRTSARSTTSRAWLYSTSTRRRSCSSSPLLLTEQSFVPLGPQVSALLPHATTDGCVPCAGRGLRGTPCAPACGQYACLSPSACVSSDCVCDLCAVGSRGLVGPPARAGRQNLSGARARAWLDLGPRISTRLCCQVDPWSRQGLLPACWGLRNNRELSLFLFAQVPPHSRHELAPSGRRNCHPGDGANPPGCLPVAQTLP